MKIVKLNELEVNLFPANSKKLLIIIHGASEGKTRYQKMAESLSSTINVITYNHPGHETGNNVDFDIDGILNNTKLVLEYGKEHFDDITIFAHSMGSLVIRNLLDNLNDGTKIILSGAPITSPFETFINKLLRLMLSLLPDAKTSKQLNYLAFDAKSSKFGLNDKTWICSDMNVVRQFKSTKLNNQLFTNKSLKALITLSNRANSKVTINNLVKFQLFLVSGSIDVFTNNGINYRFITDVASKAVVKVYPNSYHEVHNDIDRNILYKDILDFIEKETDGKN